jgi:hypothetical protein
MDWEPAHADHAIDSVSLAISLAEPIDPNTFDEIVMAGRKAATSHQFVHRIEATEPLQLQAGGGEVIFEPASLMQRRRVAFQRHVDGAVIGEFSVGMTAISLTSSRYSAWTAFQAMAFELLNSLHAASPILDSVKSIQLQYIDSFTSTVVSADYFEVISKTSSFLTRALDDKTRAFHCHSGWFDYSDEALRNLTNVNIGVVDNSPPAAADAKSKITILTMARLEALTGVMIQPLGRFFDLHSYLKNVFEEIITPEAAARIALND